MVMRRRFLITANSFAQQPMNQICYTSTDGNVVMPYATDAFGANIISNTYKDGRGVITFSGHVTMIEDFAFRECSSLRSINIPNSVTEIGYRAFWWCDGLISMTIGYGVTSIRSYAFDGCTSLRSINIPNSVTEIWDYAFRGCTGLPIINKIRYADTYLVEAVDKSLTSYTIKVGTRFIGNYAFNSCTSLTSVTIPDSVIQIGNGAFYYCTNLTSIYCKATTPPTLGGSDVFNSNASGRKIYVPYQSLDAYKTASNWSKYADDIVGYDF